MAGIAKSLTDEEILALATYYSSQTLKNIISDTIQNKQGKNKEKTNILFVGAVMGKKAKALVAIHELPANILNIQFNN